MFAGQMMKSPVPPPTSKPQGRTIFRSSLCWGPREGKRRNSMISRCRWEISLRRDRQSACRYSRAAVYTRTQRHIEEKLEKLKKLKFARTLSQELISELPALQPVTTFLLEMGGKIDVFFVYDDTTKPLDDRIEKTANSVVTKLLEKKELKTFGIKAQ